MSQPAVAALAPPLELIYSDGEPLESEWHAMQFPFLIELIREAMAEQGRTYSYAGGDMFVYHSVEQAWAVKKGRRYVRGPDVFWVDNVSSHLRKAWVSWEEGGRLPDVIIELLSPTTAHVDRGEKKELYQKVFRTPEYYMADPDGKVIEGFELSGSVYRPRAADEHGRVWSERLGVSIGFWHGERYRQEADWVRLFHRDGSLVLTDGEKQRQRAEAAEAELARLRALLEGRETLNS
jgi:Uma2 family endonuclease